MASKVSVSSPETDLQPVADPVHELISNFQKLIKPSALNGVTRSLVRGETKWIEWQVDEEAFSRLEIIQITDVQWGNLACKRERVLEYRDWVLAKPTRYMIWTGDNVDAAHMLSKGTTWDNDGPPQSQVYQFCKVWAPAAHRILGYVGGNHERRTVTTFGDLGILIASALHVPYSSGQQIIDISFGKHKPFRIHQWHGAGGARTKGTVAQKLARLAEVGDANLYLMGHHHQSMVIPHFKLVASPEHGLRSKKVIAASGSSFLDMWGSYGETAGYGPSDVLMPRTVLTKDGGFELTLK
jgi:hypothetical protein